MSAYAAAVFRTLAAASMADVFRSILACRRYSAALAYSPSGSIFLAFHQERSAAEAAMSIARFS
jgi:hypothetical protein